jgi:ribosomal protein S18 acetylase RimI-like enzyme
MLKTTLATFKNTINIRNLIAVDRNQILRILKEARMFSHEEICMAIEIVDSRIVDGDDEYRFKIATDTKNKVLGYACYGRADLSDNYWELYWMAVDFSSQRNNIGTILLKAVENDVISKKGYGILLETSSIDKYLPARQFYKNNGYHSICRIKNFYSRHNDKIIYNKLFSNTIHNYYLQEILGGRGK